MIALRIYPISTVGGEPSTSVRANRVIPQAGGRREPKNRATIRVIQQVFIPLSYYSTEYYPEYIIFPNFFQTDVPKALDNYSYTANILLVILLAAHNHKSPAAIALCSQGYWHLPIVAVHSIFNACSLASSDSFDTVLQLVALKTRTTVPDNPSVVLRTEGTIGTCFWPRCDTLAN